MVGGFLTGLITGSNPVEGPFDIASIVTAVIGTIIVAAIAMRALPERPRRREHRWDSRAFLAVPIAAAIEVLLEQLQTRDARSRRSLWRRTPAPRLSGPNRTESLRRPDRRRRRTEAVTCDASAMLAAEAA